MRARLFNDSLAFINLKNSLSKNFPQHKYFIKLCLFTPKLNILEIFLISNLLNYPQSNPAKSALSPPTSHQTQAKFKNHYVSP